MPTLFGAYIYRAGGRVEVELEHSHHPLVAVCSVNWPWKELPIEKRPAKAAQFIAQLNSEKVLESLAVEGHKPIVFCAGHWMEAAVSIAIIFEDLVEGFRKVAAYCRDNGASCHLELSEALTEEDPLAPYRELAKRKPHDDI